MPDAFLIAISLEYEPYHHLVGFKDSIYEALNVFLCKNPSWNRLYGETDIEEMFTELEELFEDLN